MQAIFKIEIIIHPQDVATWAVVPLAACQALWVLWRLCTNTGPRPALEDAAATSPVDLPLPLHCSEEFLVVVKKWVGENTRERIMLSDSSLRLFIVSKNNNPFIFFFSPHSVIGKTNGISNVIPDVWSPLFRKISRFLFSIFETLLRKYLYNIRLELKGTTHN